jgi:very-short-patch-repair endonuclease
MKFSYDTTIKRLARDLRSQSTLSEILLWRHLSNRQRNGFAFQRQKPIAAYILDFFSHELMLAVEIDGKSHKLKGEEDELRQRALEQLGIRFLRFDDREVKRNLDGVLQHIDMWIAANQPFRPTHPGAARHPSS